MVGVNRFSEEYVVSGVIAALVLVSAAVVVFNGALTGLFAGEGGTDAGTVTDDARQGAVDWQELKSGVGGGVQEKIGVAEQLDTASAVQKGSGTDWPVPSMERSRIALDYHADQAGCGELPEIDTGPDHDSAYEAAKAMLEMRGAWPLPAEKQEELENLKEVPPALDEPLADMIGGYTTLSRVTREEFIFERSQEELRTLRDVQQKIREEGDVEEDDFSQRERAVMENIDMCRVFAAYNNFLPEISDMTEAVKDFRRTQATATTGEAGASTTQLTATPVEHGTTFTNSYVIHVPPYIGIDLGLASDSSSTWHRHYAFLLDVEEDDTYNNNAGGAGLDYTDLLSNCDIQGVGEGTNACPRVLAAATAIDLSFGCPDNQILCSPNTRQNDEYIHSTPYMRKTWKDRNGGASFGVGFLYDYAGNDVYKTRTGDHFGEHDAVNGGAILGVGMLIDGDGRDTYKVKGEAQDTQIEGVNGGGNLLGYGTLINNNYFFTYDDNDQYVVDNDNTGIDDDRNRIEAVNGGAAFFGSGFLFGGGNDETYTVNGHSSAPVRANNGGADTASGFLYDRNGRDTYTVTGTVYNGWGRDGASGFFLDGDDADTYQTPHGYHGNGKIVADGCTGVFIDYYPSSVGTQHTKGSCCPADKVPEPSSLQELCRDVCTAPPTCQGYFCGELCGTR